MIKNKQAARSISMLWDAFVDLLMEKPYDKIKITEITERANLARSTFYSHYETKDDLVTSNMEEIAESYLAGYTAPTEWTPQKNVVDIEKEINFFQAWKDIDEVAVLIQEPYVEEIMYKVIRQMHLKAYKEIVSPNKPDLNPCFAGYWIEFLVSTKIALLRNWVRNDMKESPKVLGELLYALSGIHIFERRMKEFKDRIC